MCSANSGAPAVPLHFNFATDVFDGWERQQPEAPALWCVHAVTGAQKRLTFRQLAAQSCQAANLFRNCGIQRGDRVLLMLSRVPQWWVAMLGLIRLGAVPVPATLLLTGRELAFRLASAEVRAVITNEDGAAKLDGFDGVRFLVGARLPPDPSPTRPERSNWIDFDHGLRAADTQFQGEQTRSDDPGVLYFTSATTGEPKMVLHSQASYGLGHRLTGELWLDLKPTDVHWNLSDIGWAKAGWSSFFGPWQMGACVFALDYSGKFNPALALDTLAEFPITTWCAPPTALRIIVREDFSRRRFPHLRHCVTAGEPLNPEMFHRWREATSLMLYEAYGQTESVVLIGNYRSRGESVRPGSMGKPTPGFEIALLDDELRPVGQGEEGEVALRVKPQRPLGLFAGYWRNPEESARKFVGDWYLTGDRARCDEAGYYWFVGRRDDVIKSSGYRIGPFEVESALLEHPGVLDVAVIGQPDALRGQVVKACVVLRPGFRADEEMKINLQTHCKGLIAAYKYPREIEFVGELPKTTSGKTRRAALRQPPASLAHTGAVPVQADRLQQ